MRVVRYENNEQGERTNRIVDEFIVPFPVVEIRFSDRCEMEFVGEDGRVMSAMDLQ